MTTKYLIIMCALGLCANAHGPKAQPSHDIAPDFRLGLPVARAGERSLDTPGSIALGKRLFFDVGLSANGKISCSSCHLPERAFTDGRPLAIGINGQQGTRKTPSLLNVAFNTSQFWDGRRPSLEAQALDPLMNPVEHGLRDEADLLLRIRADRTYVGQFQSVYSVTGDQIRALHVARALASYERSLMAGNSPFDRFFFGHDERAIEPAAKRGLGIFRGVARCSDCHTINATYALLTDNQFHAVNVGIQKIAPRLAELTTRLVAARKSAVQVDHAISSNRDIAELGRFAVTLNPTDIGKFRTPSLRNVAITAPYMHDGSVTTLREAVARELYDHSGRTGRPLILTPRDREDLVEFLKALTSPAALPEQNDVVSR